MSKFIKYFFGLLLAFSIHGCADFVDPAIPYNNFETGVYLRTLSQTPSFNFFQLSTAKLTLVVRREQEGIRCYAHMGTGNYNATTALSTPT